MPCLLLLSGIVVMIIGIAATTAASNMLQRAQRHPPCRICPTLAFANTSTEKKMASGVPYAGWIDEVFIISFALRRSPQFNVVGIHKRPVAVQQAIQHFCPAAKRGFG